jgi:hypothetical protein
MAEAVFGSEAPPDERSDRRLKVGEGLLDSADKLNAEGSATEPRLLYSATLVSADRRFLPKWVASRMDSRRVRPSVRRTMLIELQHNHSTTKPALRQEGNAVAGGRRRQKTLPSWRRA